MSPLIREPLRGELHARLVQLYTQHFAGIASGPSHIGQMTDDSLDERRALAQLALFTRETGERLAGRKVLEIGAGVGLTVAVARLALGAEAVGIEPGTAEYDGTLQVAGDLLAGVGLPREYVRDGVGERLPFADATFEVVLSANVLEHVADPARVLDETVRVLKPNGWGQFVVPNYGSWWEGHYGIPWIPFLPAAAGRTYVRLLHRDPAFVDTLQLINYPWLSRLVHERRDEVEVLGWGQEIWEERLRSLDFQEWSALGQLKYLLRWLHRLKGVSLTIWLGRRLHWETPFVLTFRKRDRCP
jgi:SAM-dependent methyltransferase